MLAKVRSAVGVRFGGEDVDNEHRDLYGTHVGVVIDVTDNNFIRGLIPGRI